MLNRYTLIIIATIVAVFFTSLIYLLPNYSTLWFNLEFIILPIVYIIGYEILMGKQNEIIGNMYKGLSDLEMRYKITKEKEKQLRQENKKLKSSSR